MTAVQQAIEDGGCCRGIAEDCAPLFDGPVRCQPDCAALATDVEPVLQRVPNFSDLLRLGPDEKGFDRLRHGESIGRPLGAPGLAKRLEALTGRTLVPAKRGRKPRTKEVS